MFHICFVCASRSVVDYFRGSTTHTDRLGRAQAKLVNRLCAVPCWLVVVVDGYLSRYHPAEEESIQFDVYCAIHNGFHARRVFKLIRERKERFRVRHCGGSATARWDGLIHRLLFLFYLFIIYICSCFVMNKLGSKWAKYIYVYIYIPTKSEPMSTFFEQHSLEKLNENGWTMVIRTVVLQVR